MKKTKLTKAALMKKLRHTRPEQVEILKGGLIKYTPKPKAELMENSRNGKIEECDDAHFERFNYKKYCENCGKPFYCVDEERKLCDDCHRECCEILGYSSVTSKWKSR